MVPKFGLIFLKIWKFFRLFPLENNIKTSCYLARIPVDFTFTILSRSVTLSWCPYFPSYHLPLQLLTSGVARPSAALPTSQISLQEFKVKEDHASCLFKDIRMNKTSWRSQSNTHKLICISFFIIDYYNSCFICLSPSSSSLHFLFHLLSLHMHKQTRQVSSKFLPWWFLVPGKPNAWLFDNLLIPGIKRKNEGCDGGIPTLQIIWCSIIIFSDKLKKYV